MSSTLCSWPFFPDMHALVCVLYDDARAVAPGGQSSLVFPHHQAHMQPQQRAGGGVDMHGSESCQNTPCPQLLALQQQLRASHN
jgi:hypothetical protein